MHVTIERFVTKRGIVNKKKQLSVRVTVLFSETEKELISMSGDIGPHPVIKRTNHDGDNVDLRVNLLLNGRTDEWDVDGILDAANYSENVKNGLYELKDMINSVEGAKVHETFEI